jgi:hypothetical protein
MVPTKKLVFINATGMTAKVSSTSDDAWTVKEIPEAMSMMDIIAEVNGPLMATSNSADLDLGNDRRGVIEPKVPICRDGNGTGKPIFTLE